MNFWLFDWLIQPSDHLKRQKSCALWSWHNTDHQTACERLHSAWFASLFYFGLNWHTRVTLCWTENSAHILKFPCNQLDLPTKFSTDYKHHPPAVPKSTCLLLSESPPCCLYLGEIASQQALSVELCGFLRPPEPVGDGTPARQTIAMAPKDSACSLKWRWMWAQYLRRCGLSTQPLWWETALRWDDQSF